MTSSYRQDEQGNVYQDTGGGATAGGITTLFMNVTSEVGDGNGVVNETEEIGKVFAPPTENPTAQQITSWTQLFKDNPKDPKWQSVIKDLRVQYPDQLGDVNAYSNEEINNFSSIGYKAFQSRNEQIYKKWNNKYAPHLSEKSNTCRF